MRREESGISRASGRQRQGREEQIASGPSGQNAPCAENTGRSTQALLQSTIIHKGRSLPSARERAGKAPHPAHPGPSWPILAHRRRTDSQADEQPRSWYDSSARLAFRNSIAILPRLERPLSRSRRARNQTVANSRKSDRADRQPFIVPPVRVQYPFRPNVASAMANSTFNQVPPTGVFPQ